MAGLQDVVVVWFQANDLRVHDHGPLLEAHRWASRTAGCAVVHVVGLDAVWFGPGGRRSAGAGVERVGGLRAAFIRQAIADLAATLRGLGHALITFVGDTGTAFAEMAKV